MELSNDVDPELLQFCRTDRQREIMSALIDVGTKMGAARKLGIASGTLYASIERVKKQASKLGYGPQRDWSSATKEKHCNPVESVNKKARSPAELERINSSLTEAGLSLNVESLGRIQTGAEAIKKAGFDLAIWEPTKVECTSWEVAVKMNNEDGSHKIVTKPLWRVKVVCRRRVPESIEDSLNVLADRVFNGGLNLTPVKHIKPKKDPKTLIVGLVDHHFGKLCWAPETGSDYDLKIAEQLWDAAIESVLRRCEGRGVTEIILPIGNDFGHVDGKSLQTTAGTEQGGSHDGRYEKVVGVQEESLIRAVNSLIQVAPVTCIHIPGNHDRVTSYMLAKLVQYAFQKSKHVSVDTTPRLTKYVQRGKCLWGFAHGDGPRKKALQDMMPVEAADEWAKSKACREWITGHLHQQKSTEKIGTQEDAGQVFRILPSLCGTDYWHYSNGFAIGQKATQSLLYSNEYGLDDIFHEPIARLKDSIKSRSGS